MIHLLTVHYTPIVIGKKSHMKGSNPSLSKSKQKRASRFGMLFFGGRGGILRSLRPCSQASQCFARYPVVAVAPPQSPTGHPQDVRLFGDCLLRVRIPPFLNPSKKEHPVLGCSFLAEEEGFEPSCPCGQLHFECSSLQPLRYSSIYTIVAHSRLGQLL